LPKIYGRRVDEGLFDGCSGVRMPRWNKPNEVDRHLKREEFANWKIHCLGNDTEPCGEVWYYAKMDISKLEAEIKYRHPTHKKAIYNRLGISEHSYRGTLPAMAKPE